jgi:hypothetical protein
MWQNMNPTLQSLLARIGSHPRAVLEAAYANDNVRAQLERLAGQRLGKAQIAELLASLLPAPSHGSFALPIAVEYVGQTRAPIALPSLMPVLVVEVEAELPLGLPEETAFAIRTANQVGGSKADEMLKRFVRDNVARLSLDDIQELAKATNGSNALRFIKEHFAQVNAARLSTADALALVNDGLLGAGSKSRILTAISAANGARTSLDDTIRLIKAATWQSTEQTIGINFLRGHREALPSLEEVERMAKVCGPNSGAALFQEYNRLKSAQAAAKPTHVRLVAIAPLE